MPHRHILGSEEYRTIVQRSIDGFIVIDLEQQTLQEVNPAFCNMLGYSRDELIGMPLSQIDVEQTPEVMLKAMEEVQTNGYSRFETRHLRKDGVTISVEVSANYIDSGTGYIASFIRDISERAIVEEARNSFVALISHQFLTPISAIRGFADMLLQGDAGAMTAEQQLFVQRIMQSNDRMRSMVNDWLAMASIELGTYEPRHTSVDVAELCQDAVEYFTPQLRDHDIHFEALIDGPIQADTDPRLVELALENLLSNAIKYSGDGSSITLSIRADEETIKIRIQDTGPGVHLGDQQRIFKKMYRAEQARKGNTSGTGLGLYVAKRAVEYLQGTVIVASEPGHGANFTIVIPRKSQAT